MPAPDFDALRDFMRDKNISFGLLGRHLGLTRAQARSLFIYGAKNPDHIRVLRDMGWPRHLMPADRSVKLPGLARLEAARTSAALGAA